MPLTMEPLSQVCMTSNDWASPFGVFQVYCLQGTGQGLQEGTLRVGPPETRMPGGPVRELRNSVRVARLVGALSDDRRNQILDSGDSQ